MHSQPHNQNLPVTPYRRERRIEVEPVMTAIALVAMVLLIGGWKPLSDVQQPLPAELVSVKTASAGN